MEQNRPLPKYKILIISLTVFLVAILFVGATLAIMVQQKSISGSISFGKPIVVSNSFDMNGQSISGVAPIEPAKVQPGSVITGLTLRTYVTREGSTDTDTVAYVRAKFEIENIYIDGILVTMQDKIYLGQDPNGNGDHTYYWKKLTFTNDLGTSEDWWVLMEQTTDLPMAVKNNQVIDFLVDGTLVIDKAVTNELASKTLDMKFVVEAIQSNNIDAQTILTGNNGNPWWA